MEHENYTTWLSFAFSTTVQFGWPKSHFLFPLWLLVPIPFTSAPRHILFCNPPAHLGSGWPHAWDEACKLCSRWTAPDDRCRGARPPFARCAAPGFAKASQHMFVWIFSRLMQLCFKYLTLYEDVWGFLKLFLWFTKEKKSDHTNLKRMIKTPNGKSTHLLSLFWELYRQRTELSFFALLASLSVYAYLLHIVSARHQGRYKKAKVVETHLWGIWSCWEIWLTSTE